jgi:WD40 repeat protein
LDFLRKTVKVVETILEEEYRVYTDEMVDTICDPDDFVVGYKGFEVPSFLEGVTCLNPGHQCSITVSLAEYITAVTWTCDMQFNSSLPLYKTVIALYRTGEIKPFRLLACYPVVSKLIFLPHNSSQLIAGGTMDGSIEIWDVRRPDPHNVTIEDVIYNIKRPVFITDGVITNELGQHCAPIVGITTISADTKCPSIITADQLGVINMWVTCF